MKVRRLLPLLAATLAATHASAWAASGQTAAAASAKPAAAAADRQIMVMLKLGAEHYRPGGDYGGAYGDAMGQQARLRLARSIAREHRLDIVESWPMQLIGVDCVVMRITDGRSVEQVIAELAGVGGIAWTQPLQEFGMQSASARGIARYNDRLYPAQGLLQGWDLARMHKLATGKGVTIAIVDSRIDTRHPDLAGQIAVAPNFVTQAAPLPERHGTGVAGIIAAKPNNALGIAGVAPDAKVIGLRACWERPYGGRTVCDTLSLAKAINFAINNRVDILNMSLTGPRDRLIQTLIGIALARGMTVVAAVDADSPETSFPAMISGVVPVADQRLSVSPRNVYIAPGRDVPTTEPNGKWSLVSGSSFAAAYVSGLAALLHQLSARQSGAAMFGPAGPVNACAVLSRAAPREGRSC